MTPLNRTASTMTLALTLAGVGLSSAASAQTTRDDKLPTAQALLEKVIKANGGEKAIRKHKHQTLTGEFEIPAMGMTGELTVQSAAPNLRATGVVMPGFGEMHNGFDGETAWREAPAQQGGPQILEGRQRDQQIQQADFYSVLHYRKNYQSMEVIGTTEFGDAMCYEMELESKSGDPLTLYINAETNLISGSVRSIETPNGEVEVTVTFEEYKEFDGEMIATTTRQDFGGFQEQVIYIKDVSFEPIDESAFALPDSIKALMKEATSQPDN